MHFDVLGPASSSARFVVHVPHGSLDIPAEYRGDFALDDDALDRELLAMTDRYTDDLARSAVEVGGAVFVNRLSRLVMDPERFADDADEPMSRKGMGAIYRSRQDGTALRRSDFSDLERAARIRSLYEPYHGALTSLVDEVLEATGRCLLVDLHSFPQRPLPYEDVAAARPQICIGFEDAHDRPRLRSRWAEEARGRGLTVGYNEPFAGSLVPSKFHRTDARVTSLMIELRRDLYMDEATGRRAARYAEIEGFVRALFAAAAESPA